jgi:hypothetical protein
MNGITDHGVSGPITPKRAFFYWGNETMSFMRYMTLASFRALNPDWEIVLIKHDGGRPRWESPEQIDKYTYEGRDYSGLMDSLHVTVEQFDASWVHGIDDEMTDVHCKDLAMWYLLATRGGVVADMDILFIKPMHTLDLDCDIGMVSFSGYPKPGYIPVTFMMGSPNRFFRDTHRAALCNYDPAVYECCGNHAMEHAALDQIMTRYPELIVKRLPQHCVFPFLEVEWGTACAYGVAEDRRDAIPPDCIGVHWYAGNPVVNEIVQQVDHTNIDDQKGTIFKLAVELYGMRCTSNA